MFDRPHPQARSPLKGDILTYLANTHYYRTDYQGHHLTGTWRITANSKWLKTHISKSPKDRVIPFPNGHEHGILMGAILTTEPNWDDPNIWPNEIIFHQPSH